MRIHYSILSSKEPSLFQVLFCGSIGTQGLVLASQVLYHLSQAHSSFCFSYVWIGSCVYCLGLAWDYSPPTNAFCIAEIACPVCLLRWGLANFLSVLVLNCDPPDPCFLSRRDYKWAIPCPTSHTCFLGMSIWSQPVVQEMLIFPCLVLGIKEGLGFLLLCLYGILAGLIGIIELYPSHSHQSSSLS
jgi:hypothetical protein